MSNYNLIRELRDARYSGSSEITDSDVWLHDPHLQYTEKAITVCFISNPEMETLNGLGGDPSNPASLGGFCFRLPTGTVRAIGPKLTQKLPIFCGSTGLTILP